MRKQYRQLISYDAGLGHKYVPSTRVRVRYGHSGYYLETDKNGFRNSKEHSGTKGILVIGDSYAAGDGVSNEKRFSDLLALHLNVPVYNIAVSGYGIDQQLIAYKKYKDLYPHHVVIFCPHQDDIFRNLISEREGIDKNTGDKILIPKPVYQLQGDVLVLTNVPVPKERIIKNPDQKQKAGSSANSSSAFGKAGKKIMGLFGGSSLNPSSFPESGNINSEAWKISDAIIKELLKEVAGRKIIIAPFTYTKVIASSEEDPFSPVFKRYESENVTAIDLTSHLRQHFRKEPENAFLPICGHFNDISHKLIADYLKDLEFIRPFVAVNPLQQSAGLSKDEYILGISCFYHDSAATLLKNGKIIAAAQEERFTRKKHDKNFPENAIHYCLEEAGIHGEDLHSVAYYDMESLTIERVLHNSIQPGIDTDKYFQTAGRSLVTKLKLNQYMSDRFNYTGAIHKFEHHLTHAASAFYASAFENAAILILDGVGEWACSTIAEGNGSEIKIHKQQYYPHSLGLLYSAFTSFCGFKVNSGEYKLMGLAPYGKPIYTNIIREKLTEVKEDGSLLLNMNYFSFPQGEKMTNDLFGELFGGEARSAESRISRREMDLAASIQEFTEEVVIKMAEYARRITGKKNLVMAGGVALNCVANGKLYEKTGFSDFFFQPASGDAGGAMGAAMLLHYRNHPGKNHNESVMDHSYLGPQFSDSEIHAFLETKNVTFHHFGTDRETVIAGFLKEDKVIGYFDGRMEFGPRALGARSIIGNPLSPEMQSKLNLKIKFRESFRPFAPIYTEEKTSEYFEFDQPSPYMLVVRPVKESLCFPSEKQKESDDLIEWVNQKRSKLPSITHVDYSARLQSVNKNENPVFHNLLREFGKLSGWEILINTSFNVRGEPIVCTPLDAFRCFMRTHMDVLVLGNYYLIKEEQENWNEIENWEDMYELD
jgi:carbamoyltransferase